MARSSKRTKGDPVKLEMTPMIDVVFQLLIFFIVTLKQEDILSQLQVIRPGGTPPDINAPPQPDPFTILIDSRGFVYRERAVTETQLRETVSRFARYNPGRTVVIKASLDSPHHFLINVLDICALNGLNNIAVFSF